MGQGLSVAELAKRKKKNMYGDQVMSSFRDRFGGLTVEQARELNEAARWYCEHEITSEVPDND